MRKSLLSAATFLFAVAVFPVVLESQNLVLNPSFEQTSQCPQGISLFNLATNWAQGNSGADSCTTADLYAGCASQIAGNNSPNGLLGYQASRTGDHHAGIILAEEFVGCVPLNDNYREYIEGHTSAPLVANQKYLVRFYVSFPEGVMAGTDDIGMYLANSYYSHNACGSQLMPVTPQLNYCGPPILDTVNWVEVRWIYTATGGEQYFVIGNFKSDANTTFASYNCQSFNPYIYYYIDDVEISPAGANDCAFALTTTTTNAGCTGPDGTATVEATGCTSPFQYVWSNGSHTASITNVAAGNYTVTVSDNTSCSSTASVTVGSYTPPAVQVSAINANCGSSNGTAIANANGTGPYTYSWSNSATTQVINNLAAGTYTVTVTGAGSCSASASAAITASNGSLTLTGTSTPANCGTNNGTATVAVSGGSGPFTYVWNNSQTTQTISGLAPGTYTVTVTSSSSGTPTPFWSEDFTGGGSNWTFADGPGTNGSTANQWVVNSSTDCNCNTGNYLHITCNSASFFCVGNTGGCTYYTGLPVGFPPNPLFGDPTADKMAVSPAISTVGKTNIKLAFTYEAGGDPGNDYATIRLSADGGNTWNDLPTQYVDSFTCSHAMVGIPSNYENISNFKFAFRWVNNNDATGDDPGFAVDDIQLIESSASNCPSVTSVTVTGSNGLSLTPGSTSANCGQNNGTASVSVSGTGSYTYLWSNGGTSSTISNLAGGTYTVTVSDGGSCSSTASTTVASSAGLSLSTSSTNAACGNANGSATVTVSGTGTYTYQWSNGGSSATIGNLNSGTYNVTVSQNGCSATASAVVVSSAGLSATFSVTQPSCGQANGSLNCNNVSGGTQPISFQWSLSGTVISTNAQVTNLGSGTYAFHASDANGCSLDTSFVFNSSGNGGATITSDKSIMCSGDTAHICAPAGFAAYQWNTGETSQCIATTLAGNYYVTVTDAGNCTASSNHLAINVRPLPPVSISVNGDTLTSYNAVSYQWYLNGSPVSGATSNIYIAHQTGNYQVLVSDTNGCTALSNGVNITVSGITGLSVEGVNVFPNPTVEGWYLEVTNDLVGSNVQVFDDRGRVVYQSVIRSANSEIKFDAAQGVYLMKIYSNHKAIEHKLIKL